MTGARPHARTNHLLDIRHPRPVDEKADVAFRRHADHYSEPVVSSDVEQQSRRNREDADRVEAGRRDLREVAVYDIRVWKLVSARIWQKGAIRYATNIEFGVGEEEEFAVGTNASRRRTRYSCLGLCLREAEADQMRCRRARLQSCMPLAVLGSDRTARPPGLPHFHVRSVSPVSGLSLSVARGEAIGSSNVGIGLGREKKRSLCKHLVNDRKGSRRTSSS